MSCSSMGWPPRAASAAIDASCLVTPGLPSFSDTSCRLSNRCGPVTLPAPLWLRLI